MKFILTKIFFLIGAFFHIIASFISEEQALEMVFLVYGDTIIKNMQITKINVDGTEFGENYRFEIVKANEETDER